MTDWAVAVLFLAGAHCGYWIGRGRPVEALGHAAWGRAVAQFIPTKHLYLWFLVWCALHPAKAAHPFRHRNDPLRPEQRVHIDMSTGNVTQEADRG